MGRPPSYDHTMLLREIIDCLWERGYAATPISVIVQETGVNAASLYARFGSKRDHACGAGPVCQGDNRRA